MFCFFSTKKAHHNPGGLLMTANGKLRGVNPSFHYGIMRYLFGGRQLTNYRTRTVCPDTD
ncbi:MAG: hypothetical protein CMO55_12085 [Verrucomicrobiales bacterium]|nr:hypothetical protein [Verrucomicrobiales bacterium]